ncbi:MAG: type II toxin-antitoxin system RelE/ParE family toxin [Balneolaceae bacterium]
MRYSFHPEAEQEFIQSIDYYEERSPNLGYDFSTEVYSAIQRIIAYPKTWPFIEADIRRTLVKKYPYGILYHYNEENDVVFIVAVMHLHRGPDYWKTRYT